VTWDILVSGKKCAISALRLVAEAAGFHGNLMINEVILNSLIFSQGLQKNGAFVIAVR
jgi:hypothetical protein